MLYSEFPRKCYKITIPPIICIRSLIPTVEQLLDISDISLYFTCVVALTWIVVNGSAQTEGWLIYSWCVIIQVVAGIVGLSMLHVVCNGLDAFKEGLVRCSGAARISYIFAARSVLGSTTITCEVKYSGILWRVVFSIFFTNISVTLH